MRAGEGDVAKVVVGGDERPPPALLGGGDDHDELELTEITQWTGHRQGELGWCLFVTRNPAVAIVGIAGSRQGHEAVVGHVQKRDPGRHVLSASVHPPLL
jgi:hypothetical protein